MYIQILSPVADKITVLFGLVPWDKSASDGYWLLINGQLIKEISGMSEYR